MSGGYGKVDGVPTFGLDTNRVTKVIVSTSTGKNFVVRLRLDGVDNVGEFDGTLNGKHSNGVANGVPIAFLGAELHCKPINIANGIPTDQRI